MYYIILFNYLKNKINIINKYLYLNQIWNNFCQFIIIGSYSDP